MTASFAVEKAAGFASDGSTFAAAGPGEGTPITQKALLMRNLILGAEYMMSHMIHFYALAALDYVMGPPMAPWTPYFDAPTSAEPLLAYTYPDTYQSSSAHRYYHPVLRPGFPTSTYTAAGLVLGELIQPSSGDNTTNIVIPGYDFGSAAYEKNLTIDGSNAYSSAAATSPVEEVNQQWSIWSKVIKEYVDALQVRRRILEAGGRLCGGLPMFRGLVAGGVTYNPTSADITAYSNALNEYQAFTSARFIPLTEIVAAIYREYDNTSNGGSGYGSGCGNLLAWGVFNNPCATPSTLGWGLPNTLNKRLFARGYYLKETNTIYYQDEGKVDPGISGNAETAGIVEYINTSWYANVPEAPHPRHPFDGYTDPSFTSYTGSPAYTWSKAPRLMVGGSPKVMEVGPLARMWVSKYYNSGSPYDHTPHAYLKAYTLTSASNNLASVSLAATHIYLVLHGQSKTQVKPGFSVMDRHRARAQEALKVADAAQIWLNQLNSVLGQKAYTRPTFGTSTSGFGSHEAPRGALAHYLVTDAGGNIQNYQCVVPSTWNDSPADAADQKGAIEQAILSGLTVAGYAGAAYDGQKRLVPVEVIRVVHSFDPCGACTVHVVTKKQGKKSRSRRVETRRKGVKV